MRATIINREQVAEGTMRFDYDLGGDSLDYRPGQFFNLDLIDPPYTDEKGSHRHFTILNSPNVKHTVSMATRMRDSAFKRSLAEMPLGSPVEIGRVGGNFTLPADNSRRLVFLAGGIGITPFYCMSSYIIEECLTFEVTLLYSNRDRASSAFLPELQALSKKSPAYDLVPIMTDDAGWEGESRMLGREVIASYVPEPAKCLFMVAGPPAMNEALTAELLALGVPQDQVRADHFLGY